MTWPRLTRPTHWDFWDAMTKARTILPGAAGATQLRNGEVPLGGTPWYSRHRKKASAESAIQFHQHLLHENPQNDQDFLFQKTLLI